VKKLKYLTIFIYSFYLSSQIYGSPTIIAICEPLKGERVDYKDKEFKNSKDGILGSSPTIVWNLKEQKATYIITDTSQTTRSSNLGVISTFPDGEEWVSFAGLVNGAPSLLSLHLSEEILFVSQHKVLSLPTLSLPNAQLFYSKCTIRFLHMH
jgi:hypothetical protein